jgi:Family of unknown function (DUF6326)
MRKDLEDFSVNIRFKLSALWTAIMFCYIYGDYFELYVPKKVDSLLTGQNNLDSPMKLFIATIVLTIPSMMIFLSLMLKPKLTKWLNIGVAIFLGLFTLMVGIASISEWRTFYVFLAFLETFLTIVVALMAWNWKKIKAV